MTSISEALATVEGRHLEALQWFASNRSRTVTWKEIKSHAEYGARLSGAAKGIYKPEYTDFSISVKVLQDGPYPDREVEYRPDGSWVCQYFQENPDPNERDREATNRGLMLCIDAGIPVGFMIRRQAKPQAKYDVLGLGLVTSWDAGYFTIEGFSDAGQIKFEVLKSDAASTRSKALYYDDTAEDFDASDEMDLRERTIKSIAVRRGQSAFRNKLLEAYNGCCCMTGSDLHAALEAAHVSPYRGPQSNHLSNGLLLRSDIHSLFDLGLLAVDENYQVVLSPVVLSSKTYISLSGSRISLPDDVEFYPSKEALRKHRNWAALI
jgi:putative restriction endonuclease